MDVAGKHALTDQVSTLAARDGLRVLILAQSHPAAFLVDVAELADMSVSAAAQFSAAGHALAAAIESAPFPVIAAVDGPALGGGCELVLACDLAVAGPNAQFGQIEAQGGVMPAFGGTWRLPRRVGYTKALAMMLTAEILDAAAALAAGLVLTVAEHSALDAAQELAQRILPASPNSVTAIKRAVLYGYGKDPADIDAYEQHHFAALFGPDQSARMHAFLQRRSTEPDNSW